MARELSLIAIFADAHVINRGFYRIENYNLDSATRID